MMRRAAPHALFAPGVSRSRRLLVPSSPSPSPSSPAVLVRARVHGGVAAFVVGSALAAFVASLQSASADDGKRASASASASESASSSAAAASPTSAPSPAESSQWWAAPTALGKALLLAEECARAVSDTRDMFVAGYTLVRDWTREQLSSVRHRIVHRHKKVDIPYYLLPAPLPPGAQKPLTLVIELDLLFHAPPERIQRAGFEYFLTQTSDFCELVLVSDQRAKGIFEAMQGLDPLGLIAFRLSGEHFFDEHARYRDLDTAPVRDLARLQRDLRHVVVVSSNPERYARHGENVLHVAERMWHRDADDRVLFELVPVLLHLSQQSDVRRVLPRYDGLDVAALTRAHLELSDDANDAADADALALADADEHAATGARRGRGRGGGGGGGGATD